MQLGSRDGVFTKAKDTVSVFLCLGVSGSACGLGLLPPPPAVVEPVIAHGVMFAWG